MSDTTYDEIVEPGTGEATEESPNIARMREKIERQEAELKELRVLKVERTLREAGFDPASDKGKALADLIDAGKVTPSTEGIKEAAGRYGWTGGAVSRPVQPAVERIDEVFSQSISDDVNPDEKLDQEIIEANARGDVATAIRLKQEKYGLR